MKITRHGFSVGTERIEDEFFLSLKAVGKLTHDDYKKIAPMIDAALEAVTEPIVRVFIDASDFEGWELRAAWDDFKIGVKHVSEVEKVAIFGHQKWQEVLSKIGSWFSSGEVKYFEDSDEALKWLRE